MRNFKKIALGLVVMLMAFGFSAFKAVKDAEARTGHFFQYVGPDFGEADKDNWIYVPSPSTSCNGQVAGCLIEVDPTYTQLIGSTRVLTQNVPVKSDLQTPDYDPDDVDMILSSINRE